MDGNTVFHATCMYQFTEAFVMLLLNKCSEEALQMTNKEGSLSLHIACVNNICMPTFHMHIEQHLKTLAIKDNKEGLQLHRAFQVKTATQTLV
jgi:hypothetical protein